MIMKENNIRHYVNKIKSQNALRCFEIKET